jgi:hypothetical protein
LQVDVLHLAQKNGSVALVAQDVSNRRRDVALGKNAGRHLVEQRLEEVVVVAVDDRDVNIRAAQGSSGEQTTEAAAHDYDAVPTVRRNVGLHAHDCTTRVKPDLLDDGIGETLVGVRREMSLTNC